MDLAPGFEQIFSCFYLYPQNIRLALKIEKLEKKLQEHGIKYIGEGPRRY